MKVLIACECSQTVCKEYGKARCWHEVQGQKNKAVVRSKTFPGIAKAMAEQWGIYD